MKHLFIDMSFHKKRKLIYFDLDNERPLIRMSICTGEKVAGFKNIHTGAFREVMLIKNEKDKKTFMKNVGVNAVDIEC